MSSKQLIPIYTLKDLTQEYDVNLVNQDILVIEGNTANISKIKLNYPTRVISIGLFVIMNGELDISIDFQTIKVKKQDVISLLPNNILEFKQLSQDCEMKAVLFETSVLSELNLQVKSREAFDIFTNNYSKMVSLDNITFCSVVNSIERIKLLNNSTTDNFLQKEMIKSHLSLIIFELANYNSYDRAVAPKNTVISSRKEDIALQFVNLVGQHFRSHKNVQFYADKMHISRKHLTRNIKEVFQIVPKQIIENKIIAEAKVLLLKNELNINQIMTDLKFEDQAMFSKFFKKNTGYTPTSYRKYTME